MKRYLLLLCVLLLSISMKAQTYTYHYWFDSDIGQMQSGAVVNGNISLDVNSLEEGLHWLNIMLKRDDYSVTERYLFFKTEEQNVTSLNYWFDEEASGGHNVAFTGSTILIDVSELPIGDHILNIQLLNGLQQSVPQSYEFYRSPMVRVFANPEEGGEVSVTVNDTLYTITAVANWDYTFVNWMSDNIIVSTATEYEFTTEEDVDFIANFNYNEGVDEIDSDGFILYPNPSINIVFVECPQTITHCDIYSIDGMLVYSSDNCSEKMEINVENLSSGTYIIKISSDGYTQNRVFIKK